MKPFDDRMRIRTTILFVCVAAAVLTFAPRLIVLGRDDFTVVDSHKVFIYGFPLHIVDCAGQLPIQTPGWQVPLRFFGNFTIFLSVGLLVALMNARRRGRKLHREAVA